MDEAAGWEIVSQREDFRDLGDGSYGDVMVITFRTGAGNRGSVMVPTKDYTVARVRQLVADKAANMDAVGRLSGG